MLGAMDANIKAPDQKDECVMLYTCMVTVNVKDQTPALEKATISHNHL